MSKTLTNKYHLPDRMLLIGNIGQIIPWKNQSDYLLVAKQLLRKYKNLHFFMVGAIMDNRYYMMLNKQIRSLGLGPHITFAGHVDHIAEYMAGFAVVLHTAIDEPFGRVLIEAAASAKPVVAYASGGPSEIIINGKTGFLVADGDIENMAHMTAQLLDNPELRTNMGQSALEYIACHFNSREYARKVYQILDQDQPDYHD